MQPKDEARHVIFHSHDGYTTNVRLDQFDQPDVFLVHQWEGEPITRQHGGPVRVLIPRLYLWKSAKWVRRIELIGQPTGRGFGKCAAITTTPIRGWRNAMADATRRLFITAGAAIATMALTPEKLAWDFSFPSLEEGTLDLGDFRRRVLLVTNTASFCGFTYQYEQLQKLHAAEAAKGLTVVGVPSQDFNQESASNGDGQDSSARRPSASTSRWPGSRMSAARRRIPSTLGEVGSRLGTGLELQQGADRPRRAYPRGVRQWR